MRLAGANTARDHANETHTHPQIHCQSGYQYSEIRVFISQTFREVNPTRDI